MLTVYVGGLDEKVSEPAAGSSSYRQGRWSPHMPKDRVTGQHQGLRTIRTWTRAPDYRQLDPEIDEKFPTTRSAPLGSSSRYLHHDSGHGQLQGLRLINFASFDALRRALSHERQYRPITVSYAFKKDSMAKHVRSRTP
ncbi:hypothetical protein DPEC_G00283350 [Dallia pectoralis]|uniref:Uncharacterized protein n=1 Tax=Dallia pectoralis TaxID=75939 RepID=A0ACC2FJ78_DALPE|nr:hypothetical protein DPEC_G00283350 [Dallia pectoralis]